MKIGILNGPNLNLLGQREPEIYGDQAFESIISRLEAAYPAVQFEVFQSNQEGELIDRLHRMADECDGLILNPAAFTHTSLALADAVKAVTVPVVEVHLSNVYRREGFRHKSYVSPAALGTISGFGLDGYRLATEALLAKGANI